MNRRQFIAGAMAAVAASYVGGEFILDESKMVWKETTFDYNNYYGMALEYTKSNGEIIRYGARIPTRLLTKPGERFSFSKIPETAKNDIKKLLVKWLEETVEA